MKKIAVFTSGGDAPGMNACVRAVVRAGIYHNLEVVGIMHGYTGMIEGDFVPLTAESVANILQRGGTILKSARSKEFMTAEGRKKAYENIKAQGIEGLVCIGGDGTFTGATKFFDEYGIPCMGAPGTIDNDLYGTDYTIGFDTAVNTALDAIDKIRDTADSHDRIFFVEVMGRHSGAIALEVGIAGGAEAILLPEINGDAERVKELFIKRKRKKSFSLVVVAEGDEAGGAYKVADALKQEFPEMDMRVTILGHVQRGGSPTANDRVLATRLGAACVENLLKGETNKMAGIINKEVVLTPFTDAIHKRKELPNTIHLLDWMNV
jgi:6-phosphofructokinase 1